MYYAKQKEKITKERVTCAASNEQNKKTFES